MRLLVTGACGFIGSNFVRWWTANRPADHVVALDLLTYAGVRENLDGVDVEFVHGDLGDAGLVSRLLAQHRVGTVVNFGAETHNSMSVLDPAPFLRTNVLGTQQLLEAARRHGVDRFHHVSTDEVYGDLALDDASAFTEQSLYRPRTPYAASKAGADHVVRAYFETYGLPVTITNCANNYGPYQFPEKVLPLFTTNALDDEPLPVYASFDNRREWLHVDDHCTAIEAVIARGSAGETYNVGSGVERSVDEVANAVLDALGKPRELKRIVPDRPGHDRRYALDSSKLRGQLGWEPAVDVDDGFRATIEWYAEHRSWWEPLKRRRRVDESGWRG